MNNMNIITKFSILITNLVLYFNNFIYNMIIKLFSASRFAPAFAL